MSRNHAMVPAGGGAVSPDAAVRPAWARRPIVLVGLMGAGKTSIGRRLAARAGLPFRDADAEIEAAAGLTIAEIFERYGEPHFRDGERRVIARLLADGPSVIATGGGAYMDPATRAAVRAHGTSVWLRCRLPTLVRRVAGREHRPLLKGGDPVPILMRLMGVRHPVYAEADVIVDCGDEMSEVTTNRVQAALETHAPPRRVTVALPARSYDIVIGPGLLARAGAHLAPVLPARRAVIVTDSIVGPLHAPALVAGLNETGVATAVVEMPAGEQAKSLRVFTEIAERILALGIERRTTIVALGGGVVGDLAGFVAATLLRGLPFVQVPTTLLAQVDSSVGGKTGLNTPHGKNLVGAFHQPLAVLADTAVLGTLPAREMAAGWAEIAKAGLIGDADFFDWCETFGAAAVAGDRVLLAEAIARATSFKAAVVLADEREEMADGGRALLNLGHTFGHALEAETGYSGALLHGEAVGIGLGLAFDLSARLGHCDAGLAARVRTHLAECGLPATLDRLNRRFSAAALLAHMRRDKKVRDGTMTFVLARGVGEAFTSRDVPEAAVAAVLRDAGCDP
jgi:shikimate kinase/3-dehydroquinate synthase